VIVRHQRSSSSDKGFRQLAHYIRAERPMADRSRPNLVVFTRNQDGPLPSGRRLSEGRGSGQEEAARTVRRGAVGVHAAARRQPRRSRWARMDDSHQDCSGHPASLEVREEQAIDRAWLRSRARTIANSKGLCAPRATRQSRVSLSPRRKCRGASLDGGGVPRARAPSYPSDGGVTRCGVAVEGPSDVPVPLHCLGAVPEQMEDPIDDGDLLRGQQRS
jgi:hypothetical protein